MALPVEVDITLNTWTIVATNVQIGNVWIMEPGAKYAHTYVATGAAAPLATVDGAPMPEPGLPISVDVAADIYVKALGRAGKVSVAV